MVLRSALIPIIQYISLPPVWPSLLVITQCFYSLLALSLGLGNQLYTQTQLGHNPRRLSLTTLSITGMMETHKNDSGVSRAKYHLDHDCILIVLGSALITITQDISLPPVSPGLLVITQCFYSLLVLSLGLGNQLCTKTQLGHNPRHLSLTTLSITGMMETHKNDSGVSRAKYHLDQDCILTVLQSALITRTPYISLPPVSPGLLVITQCFYS